MPELHIGQVIIIPFLAYIWARMNVKSVLKKNDMPFSNTLHFKNYKTCRLQAQNIEHQELSAKLTKAANYYIYSLLFMAFSFVGVIVIMIQNK
mgnify:CR=1 FL=1